MVFH